MDLTENQEALLAELKALRRAIRDREPPVPRADSGLVLLRLCSELDLPAWDKLAQTPEFRDWMALPLDDTPLPYLERIQQSLKDLSYLSEHDHLTKLANRAAFDRLLKSELDRAHRAGASLSLAVFDIDDFKKVNDSYGHPCGDKALKSLAKTLTDSKRGYDIAARIGGEEFALILPGIGMARAESMLERLLAEVREVVVACPEVPVEFSITISVGVACTKGKVPVSAEKLFGLADTALYEAKGAGKDRVTTAPIVDLARPPEKTLVRSDEKQFLFTGKTKG